MAKITVEANCGNAPKKEFLKNFHRAMANGDLNFVTANISDTFHWEIIGDHIITDKGQFAKAIQAHQFWKVKELIVDAIITHGNEASVNGKVITADDLTFSFCNVYKFKGFKGFVIKKIRTYVIQEKRKKHNG